MPLLMQTLHLIQNVISSLWIKPRSRLIEHEHIRLHRKDPGDRHTALLSARKLERRLFKILLLQSDKPQCLIRTPLDLLLWKAEILRAKADVCKYIDLEQLVLRILEYQPDLAAQLLHIVAFAVNIRSIIIDSSARSLQKPVQMLDQGRLS